MASWRIKTTEANQIYLYAKDGVAYNYLGQDEREWDEEQMVTYPLPFGIIETPGEYVIEVNQSPGNNNYPIEIGYAGGEYVTDIYEVSFFNTRMFANLTSIKTINLSNPSVLQGIGGIEIDQLFLNCSSLEYVYLGIKDIYTASDNIFSGCSSLREVVIAGNTSVHFGGGSFRGCSALETVRFECPLTIDRNIFAGLENLKTFTWKTASAIFPSYAMQGCEKLQEINITGAVEIQEHAFEGCSSLQNFYAKNILITGSDAFSGCEKLEVITSADITLSAAGQYQNTFKNNYALEKISSLIYSDTSTDINLACMFQNCKELTYIPFSLPVGTYGTVYMNNMYSGCNNIKTAVDLSLYQNRTDCEFLSGYDCFTFCIGLTNYDEISDEWGGGITITGTDVFEIAGKTNEVLSCQLDVEIQDQGEDITFEYVAKKLPDGFSLSADGIVSGIATSTVIGAYYIDAIYGEYAIKTITINFKITNTENVVVDQGTVGYMIGNKFLKLVV